MATNTMTFLALDNRPHHLAQLRQVMPSLRFAFIHLPKIGPETYSSVHECSHPVVVWIHDARWSGFQEKLDWVVQALGQLPSYAFLDIPAREKSHVRSRYPGLEFEILPTTLSIPVLTKRLMDCSLALLSKRVPALEVKSSTISPLQFVTDESGVIIGASELFMEMFDLDVSALESTNLKSILPLNQVPLYLQHLEAVREYRYHSSHFRLISADGQEKQFFIFSRFDQRQGVAEIQSRLSVAEEDIMAGKKKSKSTYPVPEETGPVTTRYLNLEIARLKRYGGRMSLIQMRPKFTPTVPTSSPLPKTLGLFGNTIKTHLREVDIFIKKSSDLFYLFLPDTEFYGACTVCRRIKELVRSEVVGENSASPDSTGLPIAFSIAMYTPENADKLAELL